MKKVFPIIVFALVALAAWYFIAGPGSETKPEPAQSSQSQSTNDAGQTDQSNTDSTTNVSSPDEEQIDAEDPDNEGIEEEDVRPATEIYKTAEDALQAIKNASKNYDDVVLEQFAELGPNCKWCDSFYSSVSNMLMSPDTSSDERSYYAEVLAISGRVENIKTLVEAIRAAGKPEDADVFAEALELATGKDDVTTYLGSQLSGANDNLKESLVAALTNQSSRLAADILYKNTVERGDADGYYSEGIGLGEFIPDEEAMPYLQELVTKRDQYSHLAFKSLLNGGADGLRIALDTLENSRDVDFDRRMIKDAVDHVNFDEEIEELLKKRKETTKQPVAQEFINEALLSFNTEGVEETETGEEP